MSGRDVRRYVEQLLAGRRPRSFRPDAEQAEQMRTAIDLRAARLGSQAPSEEFLADLHRRLAAEMNDAATESRPDGSTARRNVLIGTSAAAVAAAAGAAIDHAVTDRSANETAAQEILTPNNGAWHAIAASSDLPEVGIIHFDVGTLSGFVRRVNGIATAVSGVCTHQGCKLWLDAPVARLRCPCHSTSFAADGRVLEHQLPIAPTPLPRLEVRENNGTIEVFAPTQPG
ncbi:ubiquinol-cytochrome c reductase iron-sulfur subunit [Nocardia sp. NPDC006044]|uniref:QcrA and Rieske domain-containing protein n=1 Tax=Nocardia sp. NPDC006044 TaxID=3364306 RepID=UPI0036B5937D